MKSNKGSILIDMVQLRHEQPARWANHKDMYHRTNHQTSSRPPSTACSIGGQSQFSSLLELEPKSDRIQTVLTYARRNLAGRLSVDDLAGVAHLSPRQFSRAFQSETGQTPAKAVENLRLEGARALMEDTNHTLDVVAQLTGFGDRNQMRRAFLRAYGQPPQAIRRQSRGDVRIEESELAEG
jgi:transcriptional regulator GlxA family with amidase domain